MDIDIKNLHPLEIKLLLNFAEDDITADKVNASLGFEVGQCNQVFSWLSGKNLIVEKSRTLRTIYELTDFGAEYQAKGTPAERILKLVSEKGAMTLPEIAQALSLENKDVGTAFGALSKEGIMAMDGEKKASVKKAELSETMKITRALLDRGGQIPESDLSDAEKKVMGGISKKRGAAASPFKVVEREDVVYGFTEAGIAARAQLKAKGVTGEEIGVLTADMLKKGDWKGKTFRSYNVKTPPTRVLMGRHNPYTVFLDGIKDKLVSLGFEEYDGPLVEAEFWNCDALFMPQFHAARDIHDVYHIKTPTMAKEIEQPYLDRVAEVHKNGWNTGSRGWGYEFDRNFTKRLILRSQGTVLSAKQLHKAKIPGKYFGIARCFRYDKVDATHLSDFYQTEGIVLGENVNMKTLLGLLKMFAVEFAGATEVMYVPGYFPFTEPSVEIHVKHPVLGWIELGGAGIFRPEVTKPMNVDVPVLAWGIGIDRMALMSLELNDLRELFSPDIENVRLRRGK
ncbi:MAG: phenylalanine--tRNA ligase subunit alpha [Spirochaetia bacterium]|nr:phenylalanine--tRNA ligase subunit alpha [Spirochaetia bacterium]